MTEVSKELPQEAVVQTEVLEQHIRQITLNRPFRLNAMSGELMSGIYEAVHECSEDNDCRVIILTGRGRGFCSGLDLEDHGTIPNVEGLGIPRLSMRSIEHFSGVVPAMRRARQPILCAIKGPAYGGGFCLAMGADLRIAGESAVFNSTGIVNGLTSTELGVSWLLPRLVGAARANDIMLTGRSVDAGEAERIGLVSEVVADERLDERALEIARQISRLSPHGVMLTKQVCWANLEISSFEAAMALEDRNQLMMGFTSNLQEAIRARKESRSPVYRDLPQIWPKEWGE